MPRDMLRISTGHTDNFSVSKTWRHNGECKTAESMTGSAYKQPSFHRQIML